MASAFPIPIEFDLPNTHWRGADPDSLEQADAFAVALRWGSVADGFVPILTVRGTYGVDLPSLEDAADSSVESLRSNGASADLIKRTRVESEQMPAIVQLTEVDARIDGSRFDLYQAQVIETLIDSTDRRKRVMLSFTVTCKYGQFAVVGPEFESFMGSVVLGGRISGHDDIQV
ncbi:hypothetical protein G5C66_01680 [Nocardioides sp. KC13]|uniref:DUF1795 domain-containing protein n=1 Tax=Nocardioides turkmenicus TaxID=2711220 RepID=A0A6M1R0Y8_9ACTN|nr:hypothetical protein [Nocardioides sp. KC13]NGN91449.1 hypothetical protein [Nocardioides sp. KC13]